MASIYANLLEQKKTGQLPEDWFGTPTWPPFIVLGHQYGRRDVMWKLYRGVVTRWGDFPFRLILSAPRSILRYNREKLQAPVDEKVNDPIHRINPYPLDSEPFVSLIRNDRIVIYPEHSTIQRLNNLQLNLGLMVIGELFRLKTCMAANHIWITTLILFYKWCLHACASLIELKKWTPTRGLNTNIGDGHF